MLFTNLARDTADAYLADGLASEIATSLARVPRLEVRSPSAVRSAQRGADADARTVGRRLNVRYVVEGEFQRGGDRVRIAVRLVAVANGTQRWSEAYTRPAADLLGVQEEIAGAVATAIAGQLLPQERTMLARRATREPEAYDRFLRGNFHLARRTPAGVARAIDEYAEAVRRDPGFAEAHARMALGYAFFVDWGWDLGGVPRDSALARGERSADLALAADSVSSDGWMARAYLRSLRNPQTMDGVLVASRRAIELDPRNAEAWHQHAAWFAVSGRVAEGIEAERRALSLDRSRPVSGWMMGNMYEALRNEAAAREAYDTAIAADAEFYPAYNTRAFLRLRTGDVAGARADAEAALRFSPSSEQYYGLAPLAAVAAGTGDTAGAREFADRLEASFATRTPSAFNAFIVAAGLVGAGRREAALRLLDRARPQGCVLWFGLKLLSLDPLRADPRFQRLRDDCRPAEER